MASESESASAAKPSASSRNAATPRKKKGAKKPKVARLLTEKEINVPDLQTLGMMGVMATTAVLLWIFAHAGCNYHPPRETRRSRDVTTAELTRDPKDAAIEFQQRLATLDHKGALEIAAGALTAEIQKDKATCDANATACAAKKTAAAQAITVAVVLERETNSAQVRVTTHRLADGSHSYLVLAERAGSAWKVTARVADAAGAKLPAPVLAPPTAGPGFSPLMPAPAGAQGLVLPPGHP